MPSYTEAIEFLENNFERAQEKGIAYNNRYEVYCVEQNILPTEEELKGSEDFAYDWFMALYYNQPQLLEEVSDDLVTQVIEAAIIHSADQPDMRYMIAREVAKHSVGSPA